MLSRLISRSLNLRSLTRTLTSISSSIPAACSPPSSNLHRAIPFPTSICPPSRAFSSDDNRRGGNGDDRGPSSIPQPWTLTPDDDDESSVFGSGESDLSGIADDAVSAVNRDFGDEVESKEEEEGGDILKAIDKELASKRGDGDEWETAKGYEEEEGGDIFKAIDKELASKRGDGDEWETAEGYEPWTLGEEDEKVFDSGEGGGMEGLSAIEGDVAATGEQNEKLEEEEQQLTSTLKGMIFPHSVR